MLILRPKHDSPLFESLSVPFFYLIGPVQGGGDWQHQMCLALSRNVGECIIATPCRWNDSHPLQQFFHGELDAYERQTDWEQVYIEIALTYARSCLVAWLPEESATSPRKDGSPYGRDTYGELGYFRGRMEGLPARKKRFFPLALGAENKFPGLTVIRRNFRKAYNGEFPIHSSIAEVAKHATGIARR